jgi:signal peptidase I
LIETRSLDCTSAVFAEVGADILGAGIGLRFQARGGSMHPMVRDGDVLLVKAVKPSMIKVPDVVLFVNDLGYAVVHRVIRKRNHQGIHWFTLQGDQVGQIDGIFPESQILGKVISLERNGGTIETCEPAYRWLGFMAAVRSRLGIKQEKASIIFTKLIKRMALFRQYMD